MVRKLIEAAVAIIVVAIQLWMLEPYHPPVMAVFWQWAMDRCYRLGNFFWRAGLYAQAEYYRTVLHGSRCTSRSVPRPGQ